ncbi:MAG: NAD(P)-dependent glycerol-3-phosphate dehydrogenase [Desulfobulbaceae bacterium]|jgi:glycerol-3-phosphate dehydrogenase (NAD(P)+)|nr:NAD(P)-dependent glycerol-3-phosphate dehydrogenase [Desulfobulbaceae bacterium]
MASERIAVIGAGSWGTALALQLARNGHVVGLWGHSPERVAAIQNSRRNEQYLPDIDLPKNILATASLAEAARDSRYICLVTPSHGLRRIYQKLQPYIEKNSFIVSAIKGIENETLFTMSRLIESLNAESGGGYNPPAVLSGPSFAWEVARAMPTATTIGCVDLAIAARWQRIFGAPGFRVYTSGDVIGLELSAALKNIIAIATGICDGLGYGSNTRAALITRGLAEITRLGVAMGANSTTFLGLSGVGDLILTCTGALSRNRRTGLMLAEGKNLEEIHQCLQMVAEGIKTTKSAFFLARKMGVEMPIVEQMHQILYEGKSCAAAARDLLMREPKPE